MINITKKLSIIGIVIIVIVFSLVRDTGQNVDDRLQVGLVLPSSGVVAALGEDFLSGFELAYEETGADFDYYVEDSLGKSKEGVLAANKLFATEDIDVLVSMASVVVMPLINVAEVHDVPFIGAAVGRDDFATNSKNTFKIYPNSSVEAKLAADFAEYKGYKRVGILTVSNDFGETFNDVFDEEFDGEIVFNEEFLVTEKDFRLFMSKAKDLDAIYFVGFEFHDANFLKQRKELGLSIPVISTTHVRSNYTKGIIPTDYYQDVYATTPLAILRNEATEDFQNKFEIKFGHAPDWNAPSGYDTVLILNEIASRSNEEPVEALYGLSVEGIQGLISFDEWGQMDIPLVVVDAKNDEVVYR